MELGRKLEPNPSTKYSTAKEYDSLFFLLSCYWRCESLLRHYFLDVSQLVIDNS